MILVNVIGQSEVVCFSYKITQVQTTADNDCVILILALKRLSLF